MRDWLDIVLTLQDSRELCNGDFLLRFGILVGFEDELVAGALAALDLATMAGFGFNWASTGFGLDLLTDLALTCVVAAAFDFKPCVAVHERLVSCSGVELLKADCGCLEASSVSCMWLVDVEG
jgi:hypothetical protein